MNLREYLEKLNTLAKDNPSALELEVVTSKDDEGNEFTRVYYEPSLGWFEDYDFTPKEESDGVNAVCLN